MRIQRALIAGLALPSLLAPLHAEPPPARPPSEYASAGTPLELGLAGYAKVLCSAIFVSGPRSRTRR